MPVGGKVHAMNWQSLWVLHWHHFPNECTQYFRFMWLPVGCWQSSANALGQRCSWIQPFTLRTHIILAKITVSGGLKKSLEGQQTKASTNACQKPVKGMVHFSRAVKKKTGLFLCDFSINSILCVIKCNNIF